MNFKLSLFAGALALLPTSPPIAEQIDWHSDFSKALEEAKAQKRVLFIAVNMDGERANDVLAKDTYHDRTITELTQHTTNLISSNAEHSKSGECPRFGELTCAEHRAVDIRVREQVLKPDSSGYVIAPQHVFLSPEGEVLLSVPYQVSNAELEWCFVRALKLVDPGSKLKASSRARPPKRLLMGAVIDTATSGDGGGAPGSPATREEVLQLIAEVKKGKTPERGAKIRRIMTADEPEALDFISQQIRSLKARGDDPGRQHRDLLENISRLSPSSYWELVAELAENSIDDVRAAAAACLEQLAHPDSLKVIRLAIRDEKLPNLEGKWLRAMANVAPYDKKVRKEVMKSATKAKDPGVRIQAIVALGYLISDEKLVEALQEFLADEDIEVARAAACAIAISRDGNWLETLKAKEESTPPGQLRETLQAAIAVLIEGRLEALCLPLMDVCQDEIPRPRFFGYPPH